MPVHAFVDETKVQGLLVVAAILQPRDLAAARAAMRALLLPRQTHIHFVKERMSRKAQIADSIARLPVQVNLYDARGIRDQREARCVVLRQLVSDLADVGAHRLVIEQDDSLVSSDQEVLFQSVRRHGLVDSLAYEHLPARGEPLLWIPDAAAWCWSKGGAWRDRIEAKVGGIAVL